MIRKKKVQQDYLFLQNYTTSSTPTRTPKGIYGTVNMLPVVNLLENVSRRLKPVVNDIPLCFEDMDINHGLVLYETYLPKIEESTKLPLVVNVLNDRATVFLNDVRVNLLTFHSRCMSEI